MSEAKTLFVEKELNRWKRPEPPKPGKAHVFIGNGRPALVVEEGGRGPTQGELIAKAYSSFYEVDMGDRVLNFCEDIACADAIKFNVDIRLTYAVHDPAIVLRRARTDADRFLKNLAEDAMRRTIRRFNHNQGGEAENAVVICIELEVKDNGFKLTRPAFVKMTLDKAIEDRMAERIVSKYDFDSQQERLSKEQALAKVRLSGESERKELELANRFSLKKKRAEMFAPLIEAGNWAALIAMLDPNDPEDNDIRLMVETTRAQQQAALETKQKIFEMTVEKGALEGWELEGIAKVLVQDLSGISDQTMALIEGKQNNVVAETDEVEDVIPETPDELDED